MSDRVRRGCLGLLLCGFFVHMWWGLETFSVGPHQPRVLYFNEILALLGGMFFLATPFSERLKSLDQITLPWVLLFTYCLVKVIAGLIVKSVSFYIFLRTTVCFYSMFGFFVGVALYPVYQAWLKRFKLHAITVLALFLLALLAPYPISTTSVVALLFAPFSGSYYLLPLFLVVFGIRHHELTLLVTLLVITISSLSLGMSRINKLFNRCSFYFILFMFIFAALSAYYALYAFYIDANPYVAYVTIPLHTLGLKVADATWRLMFWAYLFNHVFLPHFLFGINFGQPLFTHRVATNFIFLTNTADMPYFNYTLGAHNIFITALARLGILGFIPLIMILEGIFVRLPLLLGKNTSYHTWGIALAFIAIFIASLFNVVWYSPRYAGILWVLIGMTYAALAEKGAWKPYFQINADKLS